MSASAVFAREKSSTVGFGRRLNNVNRRETGTMPSLMVTTKFDVVVEKLLVSTTGAPVRAGQPLARVWIQTPDVVTQMGPDVITRQIDFIVALQDKDSVKIAHTENVLRQYGIPASAIALLTAEPWARPMPNVPASSAMKPRY